jgi:hypothetical protein
MTIDASPAATEEKLIDVLRVGHVAPGLDRVSEVAALRVGGIEAPDTAKIAAALKRYSRADFAEELNKLWDIDAVNVIAAAWSGAIKVRAAVRDSLAAPDSDKSVDLPAHKIESVHRPRLVLSVGGADWCQLDFELTLCVSLASARLTLRAGRLVAMRIGVASASLKLECEDIEIKEFKREALKLAPEHRFEPPLDLSRFAAAPAPTLAHAA